MATADDKDSEVYDFGGLTCQSGNFNKQKKEIKSSVVSSEVTPHCWKVKWVIAGIHE